MRMLSPVEVAKETGLPYGKALLIVKSLNYVQIGNRYYISQKALEAFLNPETAMMLREEEA